MPHAAQDTPVPCAASAEQPPHLLPHPPPPPPPCSCAHVPAGSVAILDDRPVVTLRNVAVRIRSRPAYATGPGQPGATPAGKGARHTATRHHGTC